MKPTIHNLEEQSLEGEVMDCVLEDTDDDIIAGTDDETVSGIVISSSDEEVSDDNCSRSTPIEYIGLPSTSSIASVQYVVFSPRHIEDVDPLHSTSSAQHVCRPRPIGYIGPVPSTSSASVDFVCRPTPGSFQIKGSGGKLQSLKPINLPLLKPRIVRIQKFKGKKKFVDSDWLWLDENNTPKQIDFRGVPDINARTLRRL